MKAGVVYPQIELGGDTGAVKAFAQAAEDMGYDHVVIYDHVLGAEHAGREPKLTGPYKDSDPFHEPMVTYAYLAGVTKTLGLATGVIILPQRQTVLFAKQAADVDLFSDGRLRLGVGVGWNWVEYDGLEMSRHFRRQDSRTNRRVRCPDAALGVKSVVPGQSGITMSFPPLAATRLASPTVMLCNRRESSAWRTRERVRLRPIRRLVSGQITGSEPGRRVIRKAHMPAPGSFGAR